MIADTDDGQLIEIPCETALYVLPSGADFANEDRWNRLINVQYLGAKEVYLRGLTDGMSSKLYRTIVNWFKLHGITTVRYRHRGKDRII